MRAKQLRGALQRAEASWSLTGEIDDNLDLDSLAEPFGLGALPDPPGAFTALYPRIRADIDDGVRPFEPGQVRWMRPLRKALPKTWDWRSVKGSN